MNKIYLKITGLILVFFYLSIFELKGEELLTWQDCVKEALNNNPDLLSAKERIIQAKEDKSLTKSAILPQISSQLSSKKSKTSSQPQTDTYSYSLTAKQLLFDGFETIYDIKSMDENVNSVYYQYLEVSSEVRFNLRKAFVNLLKAQESVSLTKKIFKRRKENLRLVELRYEAGREHKGALLTAQADLARAKWELEQAKRNLTLAQRKLIKELGREKFSPVIAQGRLQIKNFKEKEPDFESLVENTPFLKEVIAQRQKAYFELKASKAQFFPEVYLNSSLGKTSSDWPPQDKEWSVGATLSFPLFEGGSRLAEVSKAKSKLKEKEAQEKSTKDNLILSLQEAWIEFQNALAEVEVEAKYLEAIEERAKIASAQYSTGLISFDDWTIIEDNLVNAQKNYLETLAKALTAEAQWVYAQGRGLDAE